MECFREKAGHVHSEGSFAQRLGLSTVTVDALPGNGSRTRGAWLAISTIIPADIPAWCTVCLEFWKVYEKQTTSYYEKEGTCRAISVKARSVLDVVIEGSYDGIILRMEMQIPSWWTNPYEILWGSNARAGAGKKLMRVLWRTIWLTSLDRQGQSGRGACDSRSGIPAGPLIIAHHLDENNEVIMVITNVRDITELHELKMKLRENEELVGEECAWAGSNKKAADRRRRACSSR